MTSYNGIYSLEFTIGGGKYHTWNDWSLIPTTPPCVTPPPVKDNYVEIPGRSGKVDLLPFLTGGEPVFGNSTGSWEFIVDPNREVNTNFQLLVNKIVGILHGRAGSVVLTEDPTHYYIGRFYLDKYQMGNNYGNLTIKYDLEPGARLVANANLYWDNYNLATGYLNM